MTNRTLAVSNWADGFAVKWCRIRSCVNQVPISATRLGGNAAQENENENNCKLALHVRKATTRNGKRRVLSHRIFHGRIYSGLIPACADCTTEV